MRLREDTTSLQTMTEPERDSLQPQAGLVVYNSTASQFQRFDMATRVWEVIIGDADRGGVGDGVFGPSTSVVGDIPVWVDTSGGYLGSSELSVADLAKTVYVFEGVTERDTFFTDNPSLLFVDVMIAIKDTTPPPTLGIRSLDFSKAYNSQYLPSR